MTRQIRLVGIGLMVCFGIIFLQLNRLTVIDAKSLNNNPNNTRQILRDFNRPRGTVSTADGEVIARSDPITGGLQRVYPDGPTFAQVTGYFSFTLGSSGVEKTYNDDLAGRTIGLSLHSLNDLFVNKPRVGNMTVTVRSDLQKAASQALGTNTGSVVALDPTTGAVLALYSNPTYDPNELASHDTAVATARKTALDADPQKPRLAHTYQEIYFPGSTFKLVTSTAGLTSGKVTKDTPSFPQLEAFTPPTGQPIKNFADDRGVPETCGGTLFAILRVSCNSAFADMGLRIGADDMVKTAEAFGFNDKIPIDLTSPAASVFPTTFVRDLPKLAQSAIGQNDVSASPLQMAEVAAAIANGGKIMKPHVLQDVRDSDGNTVTTYHPSVWRTPMDPGSAALLHDAMVGVVQGGTATGLAVPGFVVGGKTGTAQRGTNPPQTFAWIVGFGGQAGQPPSIVVAVLVENRTGRGANQTGGVVAAPIAQAVLKAALEHPLQP